MTTLPRDSDNTPIPALRLSPDGAHKIAATSSSARNTTAFNNTTRVVGLYATGDVYIKFGDNAESASSSDHYFPGGLYYDFAIGGDKNLHTPYLAVIAAAADCDIFISEKQ